MPFVEQHLRLPFCVNLLPTLHSESLLNGQIPDAEGGVGRGGPGDGVVALEVQ